MRKVTNQRVIAGTAASSSMVCKVEEAEAAKELKVTMMIDRDCIVGEDKHLYRREFENLLKDTLDLYFRTC